MNQPRSLNKVEMAALAAKGVTLGPDDCVGVFKVTGSSTVEGIGNDGEETVTPVPDYLVVVAGPDGKGLKGHLLTWADLEATKG